MKEYEVDLLVENLRCCKIPNCPNSIEDNVLRKVRSEISASLKFIPWFNGHLSQFKLLLPAVGLVAVVSVFVTMLGVDATREDRKNDVSRALGFDVITESSTFKWDQ